MYYRWNYSKEKDRIYELHQNKVKKEIFTFTLNLDSKELCSKIPYDTIPISFMQRNYFFIHKDFVNSLPSPPNLKSFQHHNTTLPQWKNI